MRKRRFSVKICTQPSHVQDNNHVNNLNKTLYNVNSLDETLHKCSVCTQPSHVQDNNHVNNLNKTLYNVNSLDETLHNVNSLNETLLNESKLHHGLKCMYTNARSIMNKLISLESNVT